MSAAIELFIDIFNNVALKGLNGGEFNLKEFFQGSQVQMRITPVKPNGNVTAPLYSKVDITNLGLKVGIGPRAGPEALLAGGSGLVWNKDILNGYFYAGLELNTTDMNTALGVLDSLSTYFEIQLSEDGIYRPIYQREITIKAVVMGPGASAALPLAAASYMTRDEQLATFVRWLNNPNGAAIQLPSQDGTRIVVIYAGNDGTLHGDEI